MQKQFDQAQVKLTNVEDTLAAFQGKNQVVLLRSTNSQSPPQIQVSGTTPLFPGDSIDARMSFLDDMQKDLKLRLETCLSSGYVTTAAQAKAPLLPLSRRRSRDAMLAGIVGLMIGMGGAFVIEWWQGGSVADSSG